MLQKLEGNWIIYELLFTITVHGLLFINYCLRITVHRLLFTDYCSRIML
ncbi:hypothetical protein SLEP1_g47293 [Rubroshorea leprosula]|uniref:Uncharacterized protein n=1 Tax=Rubroshorea leprosula TaxID=152421 RepID=A0AAV5LPW0_9ROSI|nr:hypothetical protein SLEP1_g47293 [Rubroshorea leprosula]